MDYLRTIPDAKAYLLEGGNYPENAAEVAHEHSAEFGSRVVQLGTLGRLLDHACNLGDDVPASDAWLSPRLHAALRLTRREASNRGIWRYLASRFPDYVTWRWGRAGTIAKRRVSGPLDRQAFSRLWWQAELARNGPDYSLVPFSFENQEMSNWLQGVDAFQNRAAAIAYLRHLRGLGESLSDEEVKRIGRSLNLILTTTPLDVIAPDPGPNMTVITEWIEVQVSEDVLLGSDLPEGPAESPVNENSISTVQTLIQSL